jgi:hypothetical protein
MIIVTCSSAFSSGICGCSGKVFAKAVTSKTWKMKTKSKQIRTEGFPISITSALIVRYEHQFIA